MKIFAIFTSYIYFLFYVFRCYHFVWLLIGLFLILLENKKLLGHYNSYVKQRNLILTVLRHIVENRGFEILCARINGAKLNYDFMKSENTRNSMKAIFEANKDNPRVKEHDINYIVKFGEVDVDEMMNLAQNQLPHLERCKAAAKVDIIKTFEDGDFHDIRGSAGVR